MRVAHVVVLILSLSACSNPECADDEQKIGKTCFPKSRPDSGAAADAAASDAAAVPHLDGSPSDAPEGGSAFATDGRTPTADESSSDSGIATGDSAVGCVPTTEICDSVDNDCDGIIDNHGACGSGITVKQISVGGSHACAVLSNGTIKCWGNNQHGQLGVAVADHLSATLVPGISTAIQVAAGSVATCALLADSTLVCWGSNAQGAFGDGGKDTTASAPRQVPGFNDVSYIRSHLGATCVIHKNGAVSCWIDEAAALVPGVADAVEVSPAQMGGACALLRSGSVHCWRHDNTEAPGHAGLNVDFDSNSLGGCAISDSGSITCFGDYEGGLLGQTFAADAPYSFSPKLNEPQNDVAVGGGVGACAVGTSGAVTCWASCEAFSSGVIDMSGKETAMGITDAVEISAGGYSCVRRRSGAVSCWSNQCAHPNNTFGELGDGTTTDRLGVVDVINVP